MNVFILLARRLAVAFGSFSSTVSLLVLWNKLAFPQSCTMVAESKKWKKGRKEERGRDIWKPAFA